MKTTTEIIIVKKKTCLHEILLEKTGKTTNHNPEETTEKMFDIDGVTTMTKMDVDEWRQSKCWPFSVYSPKLSGVIPDNYMDVDEASNNTSASLSTSSNFPSQTPPVHSSAPTLQGNLFGSSSQQKETVTSIDPNAYSAIDKIPEL